MVLAEVSHASLDRALAVAPFHRYKGAGSEGVEFHGRNFRVSVKAM